MKNKLILSKQKLEFLTQNISSIREKNWQESVGYVQHLS